VISASSDKTVIIWDISNGQPIKTFKGHNAGVRCCCVSHNDKLIISGSLDKTLCVWSIDGGNCLKVLKGHIVDW